MPTTCDVLVVGAGPTGLMLAVWLARAGVRAIVVDRKEGPTRESRALGVQARTMETYDMLGLGGKALAQGVPANGAAIWVNGHRVARAKLREMGENISPHPYMFVMGQDRTEHMLLEELIARGGNVWWQTSLEDLVQDDVRATARVKHADGRNETIEAAYVVGCDGASSPVRHALGVGFPGGTYGHRFYVADVTANGPLDHGELGLCMGLAGFQAFFPMPGEHRYRIVSLVPDAIRDRPDVSFEDVRADVERSTPMRVSECHWFSTYNVHHRVASRFGVGRVFLAGDAAHIHSPVGGQGMNTGLMDATNLAWKLAAVLKGAADERILATYEQERMPFAYTLVQTTDRVFTMVSDPWPLFEPLRAVVPPLVFTLASWLPPLRREMFGLVSQTRIEYRSSALSCGRAAGVAGGDRLPWVRYADDHSNFDSLRQLHPHLQVYGPASPALEAFARENPAIPLVELAYNDDARAKGLAPGSVLFLRPDGYVGYATTHFDARDFLAYLQSRWGATPGQLAPLQFTVPQAGGV